MQSLDRDIQSWSIRTSRGQDLVEFAIVLPVLLLIAFGALDLGRVFHAYITITNAAREGARYAMSHPESGDWPAAVQRARDEAFSSGITIVAGNVVLTCLTDTEGCMRGEAVRVTITHNVPLVMGFVLGPSITMQRSVEMLVP